MQREKKETSTLKNMLAEEWEKLWQSSSDWQQSNGNRKKSNRMSKKKRTRDRIAAETETERDIELKIYIFSMCFVLLTHVHISPDKTNFWCAIARHRKISGNWKQIFNILTESMWLMFAGERWALAQRMHMMCTIAKWHIKRCSENGLLQQMSNSRRKCHCTFY